MDVDVVGWKSRSGVSVWGPLGFAACLKSTILDGTGLMWMWLDGNLEVGWVCGDPWDLPQVLIWAHFISLLLKNTH